jgi:hypothetical protein
MRKEQLQNTDVDGRTKKKECEVTSSINLCAASGFRGGVDEKFVFMGYYAACEDISGQPGSPNFKDQVST